MYNVTDNFLTEDEYREVSGGLSATYNEIATDTSISWEYGFLGRKSSIDHVTEPAPFYRTYLERLLDPTCNMFCQTTIFIKTNAVGIEAHVDAQIKERLIESSKWYLTNIGKSFQDPMLTSVFYANVPEDLSGGEIVLHIDQEEIVVAPENNRLVSFSGNIAHSVKPYETNTHRTAVVVEQFNLSADILNLAKSLEFTARPDTIKLDAYTGTFE